MPTQTLAWIVVTCLAGSSLVAGCGGSSSDDRQISTGIAPTKLLSEITAGEASQACERLAAGAQQVVTRDVLARTVCTLAAASVTDTVTECNIQRESCLLQVNDPTSEAAMAISLDTTAVDCSDTTALTQCTGTVRELERCFNDSLERLQVSFDAVSCDQAGSIGEDGLDVFFAGTFGTQPGSCEPVDCGESPPF